MHYSPWFIFIISPKKSRTSYFTSLSYPFSMTPFLQFEHDYADHDEFVGKARPRFEILAGCLKVDDDKVKCINQTPYSFPTARQSQPFSCILIGKCIYCLRPMRSHLKLKFSSAFATNYHLITRVSSSGIGLALGINSSVLFSPSSSPFFHHSLLGKHLNPH